MIPILYERAETPYTGRGIGALVGFLDEALSCEVTEELDGIFSLRLTYPRAGKWADDLVPGRVIVARPSETLRYFVDAEQAFDIVTANSVLPGIITVEANHVSYRMDGYPIETVTIQSEQRILWPYKFGFKSGSYWTAIFEACVEAPTVEVSPGTFTPIFSYQTSGLFAFVTSSSSITLSQISLRSALVGDGWSLLGTFGQHVYFNNLYIYQNSAGKKTHVVMWRKNVLSMSETRDNSEIYSGVFPYAKVRENGVERIVTLTPKVWHRSGETQHPVKRIMMKDLTRSFADGEGITPENLEIKAEEWASNDPYDLQKRTISVTFKDPEEEIFKMPVALGDDVNLVRRDGTVEEGIPVTKIVFDVIAGKNKAITIGTVRKDITYTIAAMKRKTDRL